MNIVKYRDIYLKDVPGMEQGDMDWFNENLKGKYAYALNWRWIVLFSDMDISEYIAHSRANDLYGSDYYEYSKFEEYVDHEFTTNANSVDKYVALNKFSSDSDITLDDAKKFRTWLAKTILEIKDESEMYNGEKPMLEYYAGGMYDTTISNLSIFSSVTPQYSVLGTSSCGCAGHQSGSLLTVGSAVCDPISIYRKGIYDLMVKLWSDHRYWMDLESDDFLIEFKKYIDAIVSYNLILYTADWMNIFSDCTCTNSQDALQNAGIAALKNLSKALKYMIDGEVQGNKNFIDNSLRVFSSLYYERMYWI